MIKFIMAGVEMGTKVNNKSTFTNLLIDFSDISKFFFLACSMSSFSLLLYLHLKNPKIIAMKKLRQIKRITLHLYY